MERRTLTPSSFRVQSGNLGCISTHVNVRWEGDEEVEYRKMKGHYLVLLE